MKAFIRWFSSTELYSIPARTTRLSANVCILSSKYFTGLCSAINAVFPKTKNQLCIVHQIRNSCKFVPYKDRKAVCADLKKIYGAVNLDDAEYAKEEFREKWDKKYPNILKSWDKNWAELTAFFEYPRKIPVKLKKQQIYSAALHCISAAASGRSPALPCLTAVLLWSNFY